MVQTTSWLELVEDYNVHQASPIPGKTALLVIDMQNYFSVLAGPVLRNVFSLVEACRSSGISILFTRHGYRDPVRDGGMLRRWWGDLIMFGSPEWELIGKNLAYGFAYIVATEEMCQLTACG